MSFLSVTNTFRAPFTPIVFERRQKSKRLNYLDGKIALNVRGREENYVFLILG